MDAAVSPTSEGGSMARLVIEVPEELRSAGEAMAAALETMKKTIARTGGGKAVDYAGVEHTLSEEVAAIEREGHRASISARLIYAHGRARRCRGRVLRGAILRF
jgi:hypothetical protein